MAQKYWIIVDSPRFWWFPWGFKTRYFYGKECEYVYVCELFLKAQMEATRYQKVLLGSGEPHEIRILA